MRGIVAERTRPSRRAIVTLVVATVLSVILNAAFRPFRLDRPGDESRWQGAESVPLPSPSRDGDLSVERAIENRRSRRAYGRRPLERRELGQLLWAAQGVTDRGSGFRAAPSAGALYPLELYVVVGTSGVEGLESGVYRYRPDGHELIPGPSESVQPQLRAAALDQEAVGEAAIDIVMCAVDERTTRKYGERGERRYVPMEAGHAGENVYLQAESLGLSTVAIGAFRDADVAEIIGAPTNQRPLYVFPIGERTER
jgi:SagB-type dehydrogenase family enzyme